jgi:hypothetical protein
MTGKCLTLGGSHQVNQLNTDSYYGDLSAVMIQNLSYFTQLIRTPDLSIALMDEWEAKIQRMAESTIQEDVTMIAGVPTWTLVLIKKIFQMTGATNLQEVWPNLELYIHGGVSFVPYRQAFEKIIGNADMNYVENYNASEGYFGLQDQKDSKDLLLLTNSEVFYEFIPTETFEGLASKTVIPLEAVEIGTDYALVISTSAGLWRYIIGDTVRFTQTKPFLFVVSGRTTHYINAFGEKLIIEHAEQALSEACHVHRVQVRDYTVAPDFSEDGQVGRHHWLIEFEQNPKEREAFCQTLDLALKKANADYDAKRKGNINIGAPFITMVASGTFHRWLKQKGKLGGQHKVPRLQNHDTLLQEILSCQ